MAEITLGGNPVHTIGELPSVGSDAPDFTLVKDDMSEISLSDFKGKKVVLNIFPSIDTGVCSASVREFNKRAAGLDNTTVICVSKDLPFALKRFCSAEGIDNVDTATAFRDNNSFGKDYGVVMIDGGFHSLLARSVVVLDENGTVKYTQLVDEIGQEPDYDQAIAAL